MSRVTTPNAKAMKINNRIGKYLVRYSRSNSIPLIGVPFNTLESSKESENLRLLLAGIASEQRTYGDDPKVLEPIDIILIVLKVRKKCKMIFSASGSRILVSAGTGTL